MTPPVWVWTPLENTPAGICEVKNIETGESFEVIGSYGAVNLCHHLNSAAAKDLARRRLAVHIRTLITMLEDFKESLLGLVTG